MKRKLMVFALVLAMLIQLLPVSAFAAEEAVEETVAEADTPAEEVAEEAAEEATEEAAEEAVEEAAEEVAAEVVAEGKGGSFSVTNPLYPGVSGTAAAADANEFEETAKILNDADDVYSWVDAVDLLRSGLENRKTTIYIDYYGYYSWLDESDVDDLWEGARYHTGVPTQGDYIDWHWQSMSVSWSDYTVNGYKNTYIKFTLTYLTSASQETALTKRVNQIINSFGFTDYTYDYIKAKTIYEWVTANITYDYSGDKMAHSAYKGIMEGTCVCQGYASIIYRMFLQVGLDCRVVAGDAGTSYDYYPSPEDTDDNHGWNIARIDGNWYNLDATWDEGYSSSYWDYFLKCPNNFPFHYRWDEYDSSSFHSDYPMATSDYVYRLPLSGTCGENVKWVLDGAGTLTISGTGPMYGYTGESTPWYSMRGAVQNVVIGNGVTNIGDCAFQQCYNLKKVSISNSVYVIGRAAFCATGLEYLEIPAGVGYIDYGAFDGCTSLRTIKFMGDAPVPEPLPIFTDVTATAYYPANNATWTKDMMEAYGGQITWISYNGGSGYTGLMEVNGVWGYYVNGVLQTGYTGLVKHGDGYFYVQKGILDWSFFGIIYADGYYRYIENGMITWQYTGLASMNGEYYFVQNSTVNWGYTGLVLHNGTYYYVQDGHLDWSYYGLAYLDGYWRYIEGGRITWNYTGLAPMNGEWYYVENSTLDWSYTGLVAHNGTYYYVQNSHLDWSFWGLIYADGYWRYIENGMLTWKYTGLAQMNGEYFYVVNSTLDWGYTGLIEHSGSLYYIHSGHLDWSYIGLGYHQGSWLYIYGGMYKPGYYGLTYFNNAWFYVENSRLTWNNFGLYNCDGTLYYFNYSQIDWAYYGVAEYNGKQYEVVGGIAVREVSSYTVSFAYKDHSLYRGGKKKIELIYTLATVSGGNSQVTAKINQYMNTQYAWYKENIDGMEEFLSYVGADETYLYNETGRVGYNNGKVLSLRYDWERWMGIEYNDGHYGYTFDLSTGNLLGLDELFPLSDAALLSHIKTEIRQYLRNNGMYADWLDQDETIDGYTLDRLDFYIDGNGELIICIPEYELAPGAAGGLMIPCGVYLD